MKTNNQVNLSKNLRTFRRIKDITQAQIAGYLNMNRSTYAYYETAKILPDIFTIEKIAVFYGITIDALLTQYNDDIIMVAYLLKSKNSPASKLSNEI